MKDSRLLGLNAYIGSSEREPALWAAFLGLAGSLGICGYAGCPSLTPLSTAHCLPHLCIDSALHRGTSPILSPGTLLIHCYYSASYLIALFCPGGAAGPLNADCHPTAPLLLCGWSDGLEWSAGCATSDASGPLATLLLFSLVLRPHCLTEVGWSGRSEEHTS